MPDQYDRIAFPRFRDSFQFSNLHFPYLRASTVDIRSVTKLSSFLLHVNRSISFRIHSECDTATRVLVLVKFGNH